MAKAKPQFASADYEKAFDLDQNKGFVCRTLAELFAFVTELLTWEGLVERLRLEPDLKRVTKGPGAWWFRGADSDQYSLLSGIFRPQDPSYSRPIADPDDLDRRLRHEYFQQTADSSRS
jgi:hypothetical protein